MLTGISDLRLELTLDALFSILNLKRCESGPRYLAAAIRMSVSDPQHSMKGMTTWLYPALAKRYQTTATKIERGIRRTLDACYSDGKLEALNRFLGFEYFHSDYRPTNHEFIAVTADKIALLTNA